MHVCVQLGLLCLWLVYGATPVLAQAVAPQPLLGVIYACQSRL